jgi:hypothetical protein
MRFEGSTRGENERVEKRRSRQWFGKGLLKERTR